MSERIAAAFAAARCEGRAALMPYMMAGFPDRASAEAIIDTYAACGADLVELGIPYSDPLADGRVIHEAGLRALAAGTVFGDAMALCRRVADRVAVVPMVYANIVLTRGIDRFAVELEDAGAAGAIVPDLPIEVAGGLRAGLAERGLALVSLVAPTTPRLRLERICADAEGFVYVVSLAGVTGERPELPPHLAELVASVRAASEVPVAVGFGIGTPEHAAAVGRIADGVIVGTRLVRAAGDAGPADAADAVADFLADARAAMALER